MGGMLQEKTINCLRLYAVNVNMVLVLIVADGNLIHHVKYKKKSKRIFYVDKSITWTRTKLTYEVFCTTHADNIGIALR